MYPGQVLSNLQRRLRCSSIPQFVYVWCYLTTLSWCKSPVARGEVNKSRVWVTKKTYLLSIEGQIYSKQNH